MPLDMAAGEAEVFVGGKRLGHKMTGITGAVRPCGVVYGVGEVVIELFPKDAPKHVERVLKLASEGKYDGVAFHRVIAGFMAQTGDIEFGNKKDYNSEHVGTGGSDLPDLPAEFNSHKHVKGTCSMARAASPNSANSQFFICFEPAPFLDNQYTVWGQVIKGMDKVEKIKRGNPFSGSVTNPDFMKKVTVGNNKTETKTKTTIAKLARTRGTPGRNFETTP